MKIEYLHEGSPDCPLIRIFDFTTSEVLLLKEHIHDLSCDSAHTFAIHDMPGVNAIGALRFTFTVGNRVGGDNSWGALIHPQYRLLEKRYEYSFRIRPVTKDDDVMKLAKEKF